MIKQFEVGKSYYREIPSNPSFTLIKELEKEGREPYRLYQTFEVIKRTNHFVTLKKTQLHLAVKPCQICLILFQTGNKVR